MPSTARYQCGSAGCARSMRVSCTPTWDARRPIAAYQHAAITRRWRHVAQSPDGYLYAVTEKRTLGMPPDPNDATSGVVYRIEAAD